MCHFSAFHLDPTQKNPYYNKNNLTNNADIKKLTNLYLKKIAGYTAI